MCEGSQAEGSLGQSVRTINQTKLSGEYFFKKKKKAAKKISHLGFFHIASYCHHIAYTRGSS
jgi:hypothetical protein